jgi:outer membrane protein
MPSLILNIFPKLQRAALCALVLFCGSAAIANALPNPTQIAAYEAATDDERVRLLMFLAANKQQDDAAYLLQQYPLSGPHAVNRTFFIEGLILKANGDMTGAAEKFRDALADDPGLTLVRAELAKVLVVLEEDDSAKHHLKLLEAEAPNEQAASGIRSFIDRVDSRRPYTISGYVSLAPTTNLNSGSRHKTIYSPVFGVDFEIDQASQAKSGLGVATGISGAYTKRLGNDFSFVAAGGADFNLYEDYTFNSYSLSQSAELRHLLPKGYFGIGGVASESLKYDNNGKYKSLSYGPRVSMSLQLTPKNNVSGNVVYEWRKNLDRDDSNSTALMVNASLTHGFDSSLFATVFGGLDRVRSENPLASSDVNRGGLSVYKEFSQGITVRATGQAAETNFKAMNLLAGVVRKDTKLAGTINLTKRDLNIFGFAPSVEYTYSDNQSNIALFDFDSHAVDFRLTKDF